MKTEMVTEKDLQWWLETSPTLDWTFAKTYKDDAPHSYVVRGKTYDEADFLRAVRVIRTFGEPGKFWNRTNIYLTDPETQTKWWTMGAPIEETIIINKASTEAVYGAQDAPPTATDDFTIYDALATGYDDRYVSEEAHAENTAVWKIVADHFQAQLPRTLDIGCGTGLLLDLNITQASRYVGIDPSQGMLNELVRKHPEVKSVYPMSAEEFVSSNLMPQDARFNLVCSMFGSPSYIDPVAIESLYDLTSDMLLLMHYEPGYLPDYHETVPPNVDTSRQAALDLAEKHGGRQLRIGKFIVTVITKG